MLQSTALVPTEQSAEDAAEEELFMHFIKLRRAERQRCQPRAPALEVAVPTSSESRTERGKGNQKQSKREQKRVEETISMAETKGAGWKNDQERKSQAMKMRQTKQQHQRQQKQGEPQTRQTEKQQKSEEDTILKDLLQQASSKRQRQETDEDIVATLEEIHQLGQILEDQDEASSHSAQRSKEKRMPSK
eukprot:CAMPEP_0197684876 /NCGR_PEP_ID=MMETSP1338-20131121/100089_1 /TAXON_ID=43686 ORGANISM="Pelagodinium beii, Strain RCC1491" /NCGR_SAMPLE_ID=MMETSP1338 /ASSEMBLY_ACC=CAM_ASM_000754 /LENGTH=189 /DNA_ID=CAMNT_0043266635 /DNA_START=30 /DNA_END=596 /DNA_ORIENTATION=+